MSPGDSANGFVAWDEPEHLYPSEPFKDFSTPGNDSDFNFEDLLEDLDGLVHDWVGEFGAGWMGRKFDDKGPPGPPPAPIC